MIYDIKKRLKKNIINQPFIQKICLYTELKIIIAFDLHFRALNFFFLCFSIYIY
jgi:hypothetical protein